MNNLVVAMLSLSFVGSAANKVLAQQSVGVVTALQGQAQLTRAGARSGLRFKEDLLLRDTVDTSERSLARILFGGKSTVTVRELSRLEVREESVPGGVRLHHSLSSGAVLINVVRQLMRPGDEVQVQTPNAVAGIRGTTVFTNFVPELNQSDFSVLTGSAVITPLGLTPITLTAGSTITVVGTAATGIQLTPVRSITARESDDLLATFEINPAIKREAAQDDTIKTLGDRAVKEPLQTGSAECWPYLLCEPQSSAAGTITNIPIPTGSAVDHGIRGNNIRFTATPGKGN